MQLKRILLSLFCLMSSLGLEGKDVKQQFRAMLAGSNFSLYMVQVDSGNVLHAENIDAPLIPASTMKIITTAAALDRFLPEHQFETKFFYTGRLAKGEVDGDLIVKGGGDPMLVSESLWQIAADLRLLGLRRVNGDLKIDNSLFSTPYRNQVRKSAETVSHHAYDAAVSALGVNFNTITVGISSVGPVVQAEFDPYPLPHINIVNQVKVGRRNDIRASRVTASNGQETVYLKGTIKAGAELRKVWVAAGDPVRHAGELIRAFLKGQGIEISGKVVSDSTPANAQLLYTFRGKPLHEIASGLLKYSNNVVADVLVQDLGAVFGKPASIASGLDIVTDFLRKKVRTTGAYHLEDGSGLSRKSRVTTKVLVDVLRYIADHRVIFPDFLSAMPRPGGDGSLKYRFDNGRSARELGEMIRAKTGTLVESPAVSGMAGYILDPKRGTVAFAIIQNAKSGRMSLAQLQQTQERALTLASHNFSRGNRDSKD